ncbi:MAG: hypothetical protein RIC15_00205 [Vicingaceae bacterium]
MTLSEAFDEIMLYSHFWNWSPDWGVVKDVYEKFPNSYSILTPFAYSYLEELIRSTTSDYGMGKEHVNGMRLIKLAIKENQEKSEYVEHLEKIKRYYLQSKPKDGGENRHNVAHGYMHPRWWDKESFEELIQDIARISKYSGF